MPRAQPGDPGFVKSAKIASTAGLVVSSAPAGLLLTSKEAAIRQLQISVFLSIGRTIRYTLPSLCAFTRCLQERSRPEAARRGKTRDLHILGFHPLLWAAHQWSFHRLADHGEEADGREAESY